MSNNFNNNTKVTIEDPNYDFMNAKNFFTGSDDSFRLIIIIYVIISFLLNSIIFLTICSYKRRKEYSIKGLLTWNILIINFFRTLIYMFNWLIKNEWTETILDDGQSVNIGGLLLGNPNNFALCQFQAFALLTLTMSQDIIVNIFFISIKLEEKKVNHHLFTIILIAAGYILPVGLTVIFNHFNILGINDKYCYFSKYSFTINDNKVQYFKFNYYKLCLAIIFLIRGANFALTFILLYRAIKNMKQTENVEKQKEKVNTSLSIVVITFITLGIDLLYKIISLIDSDLERKLNGIYLIINTADSIFLPLVFSIESHIYSYYMYVCCSINTKYFNNNNSNNNSNNNNIDNETTIKDFDIGSKILRDDKRDKEIELNQIGE